MRQCNFKVGDLAGLDVKRYWNQAHRFGKVIAVCLDENGVYWIALDFFVSLVPEGYVVKIELES